VGSRLSEVRQWQRAEPWVFFPRGREGSAILLTRSISVLAKVVMQRKAMTTFSGAEEQFPHLRLREGNARAAKKAAICICRGERPHPSTGGVRFGRSVRRGADFPTSPPFEHRCPPLGSVPRHGTKTRKRFTKERYAKCGKNG
jgi:hypothetical protein